MATDDQIVVGARVILRPWPEQGIESTEVGIVEWVADEERPGNPGEGREAIVRIPTLLRDSSDDFDGLREVFFDSETLARTEVF